MAVTEDIARLLLEATSKGFPEAKQQIADLDAKLQTLKAQYSSGAIDIDAFFEQGAKLQGGLDQLKGGVKAAEDAIKKYGDATKASAALAGQAQSRVANFGQAALQSGRVLQDFIQGGIGGILNNIEQLSMALGGGAGLAGVLTIFGTALFVFKPKIEEFFASFLNQAPSLLGDKIMALKKQIEELEKKPIKLSADITELENARKELQALEDARKAFEEFGKLRPEPIKKSGEEVQKVLAEAPGGAGAVKDALAKAAVAQAQANDQATQIAEEQARRAREMIHAYDVTLARPGGGGPMRDEVERQRRVQQERLKTALDEVNTAQDLAEDRAKLELGEIYKRATEGDVARQRELQQRLREIGRAELAKQIRAVSPENVRARQLEEEGGKIEEEARKELAQNEKEQAEEDAKRIEEQLHNRDVTEKELAKATEDARKLREDAEKRRIATLAKRIGGGGLGEEAQAYAAHVQERRPGISDAGLRAIVQRAVEQEVARRAPKLAPAERAGVVTAVTEQALAAPPEDVAARQRRAAEQQRRAMSRQEREATVQEYAARAFQQEGANPLQAQEIGRRAAAEFARTGEAEASFLTALADFREHLFKMQAGLQVPMQAPGPARGRGGRRRAAPAGLGPQASLPAAIEGPVAAAETPVVPSGAPAPLGPSGLVSALSTSLVGAVGPAEPAAATPAMPVLSTALPSEPMFPPPPPPPTPSQPVSTPSQPVSTPSQPIQAATTPAAPAAPAAMLAQVNGLEAAFAGAAAGLQQVVGAQQAHIGNMMAMLSRIQAGNAAMQARQRSAQSWPGG